MGFLQVSDVGVAIHSCQLLGDCDLLCCGLYYQRGLQDVL